MQVPNTYVPDINDKATMCAFAAAISRVENGIPAVMADIEAGWDLINRRNNHGNNKFGVQKEQ